MQEKLPYAGIGGGGAEPFHTRPFVVACKYGFWDTLRDNCTLFAVTHTNDGLGYAFNVEGFWKRYKKRPGETLPYTFYRFTYLKSTLCIFSLLFQVR